jgi:hypothetical protein
VYHALIYGIEDEEDKKLLDPNSQRGWRILNRLREFAINLCSIVSELLFLFRLALDNKVGGAFMFMWLLQVIPLFENQSERMWNGRRFSMLMKYWKLTVLGCLYYVVNKDYLRLKAIQEMVSTKEWRHEVVSGTLGSYLLKGGHCPVYSARQ